MKEYSNLNKCLSIEDFEERLQSKNGLKHQIQQSFSSNNIVPVKSNKLFHLERKYDYSQSSNLSLFKSSCSLNGLKPDSVSLCEFDRQSLCSTNSHFELSSIFSIQPASHDDIEMNSDYLKINIRQVKNSQHVMNDEKLNNNHKEKVKNWLENN